MCDYLERMNMLGVPTDDIRVWSGLAHRVVEYTGPFPTPEDVKCYLWLHEDSAVMLLDMCDTIDEKFRVLEDENARLRSCLSDDKESARLIMHESAELRKFASRYAAIVEELGCDFCPYHDDTDMCDSETEPMRHGCQLYDELRELGIEVE